MLPHPNQFSSWLRPRTLPGLLGLGALISCPSVPLRRPVVSKL
jgi:hypothetical protein